MSTAADRFLASCRSWDDFWDRARTLPDSEKGIVFERLTQLYLKTAPEYETKLQDVWLLREVPVDVRHRLNLPGPRDEGIDLVARTRQGKYWAIQVKFRSEPDRPLSRRELGTFTSLAFNTCNDISLAVVAHTATKPVSKRHLMRKTVEIGLDRWRSLDHKGWALIAGRLKGRATRPERRRPRQHQRAAISAAKRHFVARKATRGRLIMPCGTGKSLSAFWIAQALEAKTIVVAVPSLALIRQSVTDWTREFLAHNQIPDWICVCGDESVGNLDRDEFVGELYETGLPTHTDPKEIARRLRQRTKGPKIVFTTYQSSDKLAVAVRRANIKFDLAILDEAHKTVGVRSKAFATLLRERQFKARRRLFMTATERVFRGDNEEVLSMDNEADYGKCFFQLSYKDAIAQRIISDYKVLTVAVSDQRIAEVIKENRILNLRVRDLGEAEARAVATGVALKRVENRGVTHSISFHSSIRASQSFRDQQDVLNRLGPRTRNLHISSKKTAGERADLLREFVAESRALLTNARCLTEGVDLPAADCVAFAEPKQSRIDIVQAAGRALRRYPGKDYGRILVPLVVPRGIGFEEFAETTAFRQVARIITALSTQDERIAAEFRAIRQGRLPSGKIVEISGDVPVGMNMSLSRFADAVSARIWDSVGRLNWRDFADARAFVHRLNLKNGKEWKTYGRSKKKPSDIPIAPDAVYADSGWVSWGDWLGTWRHRGGGWRPFKDARAFARSLKLKNSKEWETYAASKERPHDIPKRPHAVYADSGWTGWGDWLGTGSRRPGDEWRPFKDARSFSRALNLKNGEEWKTYARSKKRPHDIPIAPNLVYADAGWMSWGDWLGTRRRIGDWRPFKEARVLARSLKLKSLREWLVYARSGKKPDDIPTFPNTVYDDAGWAGWSDWLGTGRRRPDDDWRPFKDARAFARSLKLKSLKEWLVYARSGKTPDDVPTSPNKVYADAGWESWGDWLGTGSRRSGDEWRPFKDARAFARSLKLKSLKEWLVYARSGKKPDDIPTSPNAVYADAGWVDWGDWLGTKRVWRPFKQARAFARARNLKNVKEWLVYAKSQERPHDIPKSPDAVYADAGWVDWGDWLGAEREWRPFKVARAFARALNLKNGKEWKTYARSKKRPHDIPIAPNVVYADAGWMSWVDWLGTGRQRGGWRSFKEARAFVRALNLKNGQDWKTYVRSKKRPHDIPKSPDAVYADAGWVDWRDWLGTAGHRRSKSEGIESNLAQVAKNTLSR